MDANVRWRTLEQVSERIGTPYIFFGSSGGKTPQMSPGTRYSIPPSSYPISYPLFALYPSLYRTLYATLYLAMYGSLYLAMYATLSPTLYPSLYATLYLVWPMCAAALFLEVYGLRFRF